MDSMASVWSCQQSVDELKNMLFYTNVELESVKNDAKEEMRRNEENVKQLLHLLNVVRQERDEARDQLQMLLNKLVPSSPLEISPSFPALQPQTPPVCSKKGSSSITDSDNNSLSETYNHHSHGSSSPIDSFLDAVSSPELSNINISDSSNMGISCQVGKQDYNVPKAVTDQGSLVIDNLVAGKPLPQQGKLLQAVMESGPLLQTLLVSGPLPRWRNPPPVQPLQMPPLSINGSDPQVVNYPNQKSLLSSSLPDEMIYHSSSQMYGSGTTCLTKDTSGVRSFMHDTFMMAKRQRCQ